MYKRKPVIGITANHQDIDVTLRDRYCQQIVAAGGVPVIIPPVEDEDVIIETLERIDALLLSGGADHDPKWQGEEPSPLLGNVNAIRDWPEITITRLAYNRQMPILGICRGIQTMAISLGGHVAQDISEASPLTPLPRGEGNEVILHSQKEEREVKTHSVVFAQDSILTYIYNNKASKSQNVEISKHRNLETSKSRCIEDSKNQNTLLPSPRGRGAGGEAVNSFHHQCVDRTGSLFRPTAWAEDGVIEAMESTEHKPMMGVQWHPEWLGEDGLPIFQWLVDEADTYQKAKRLHERNIILDSHCDTPMFFPQGADFSRRDDRILVDVEKMTDGRQDAVTMVAYVPQPVGEQTWADVAPFPVKTPKDYADLIFDKVEQIVASCPERMAIARNRDDIIRNKRDGKKTIMLGIENALAIEHNINNVEHFARRGAVYFTLCHNGDNQICDSARKSIGTWGGVSPFGADVIREMNSNGVMIDLSHAGERSFYDAVEISRMPVVCSHSNCKALCNHERNLTDDQLRTLANHDGVCQITLYEGFVSENPSEADIIKAIDHLNHAVKVMGIEHVGLGTDFDGDGGIRGIRNSSEMLNFTRHLLKQRYSEEDIALIWGENWLRALEKNQNEINNSSKIL